MEKVKINEKVYPIKGAAYVSKHIIRIEFYNKIPDDFGDLLILTESNDISAELKGFKTVWMKKDTTVWISNNGMIYPDDDTIELGEVDGETVYQKVARLEEKQASTEEELTNAQLALTELAAMAASK